MTYTAANINPHDSCFKDFFSRREFVLDFIKYYIPSEIKDHVDLSTIEVRIAGFVSEEHKDFYSDIVANLQIIDSAQELEIYFLFEHKSYPDKFARLQILNYMIQKWLDLKKNHKVNHSLPIIIPVVIYHGTANWKFGLDFADYFDLPTEAFRKYIPKFEHILHDITHMGDEAFKTSIIMEIFHLLLKYIHYPEMDEKIQEIYDLLNKLPEDDKRKEYLKIIVRYVLRVGPISVERVAEHTKRFSGGEEMTGVAFEQIRKEVEQEFLQKKDQWVGEAKVENTQDLLIELLEEELDIPSQSILDNIRSINSYDILRGLFKKARKVNSLEEFAQELDRVLKA